MILSTEYVLEAGEALGQDLSRKTAQPNISVTVTLWAMSRERLAVWQDLLVVPGNTVRGERGQIGGRGCGDGAVGSNDIQFSLKALGAPEPECPGGGSTTNGKERRTGG